MLTPGTLLQDRYIVTRQLSKGGMGAVYLVKHERLGKMFALKETFFSDDELLRRAFEREAQLLANLDHPVLPKVTDHFSEGASQFLLMEYVPGEDLGERLTARGYAFPADEVLEWADQLLDALEYLHSHKPAIIHRDIKPQNLKLTARNKIILLDFGLAKGATAEMSQVSQSIFGYTPNYAPLEQVHGEGTDARSDLYALGATLYHLGTGKIPPRATTRTAAIADGGADPLLPANEINPEISAAVAQVLNQALARNREHRPSNAREMRQALREACAFKSQKDPGVSGAAWAPTIPVITSTDQDDGQRRLRSAPISVPESETTRVSIRERLTNENARDYVNARTQARIPEPTDRTRLVGSHRSTLGPAMFWILGASAALLMVIVIALYAGVFSNENNLFSGNQDNRGQANRSASPTRDSYQFKTSTVDLNSNTVETRTGQAQFFLQDLGSGVELEMVEIPSGNFLMGSPDTEIQRFDEEGPVHRVSISGFYISKFEVTQAQWAAVARLPKIARELSSSPFQFRGTQLPADRISWDEAVEFCARLSAHTKRKYRLPSEAEWEYAARGGTTTPFPFGETITSDFVNYNGEKPYGSAPKARFRKQTTAVGSLGVANGFGLYDMSGNVREWCMDAYHGNYVGAPTDGSPWYEGGDQTKRVARGGAWYNAAQYCRSAARPSKPDPNLDGMGFRVAMTAP